MDTCSSSRAERAWCCFACDCTSLRSQVLPFNFSLSFIRLAQPIPSLPCGWWNWAIWKIFAPASCDHPKYSETGELSLSLHAAKCDTLTSTNNDESCEVFASLAKSITATAENGWSLSAFDSPAVPSYTTYCIAHPSFQGPLNRRCLYFVRYSHSCSQEGSGRSCVAVHPL